MAKARRSVFGTVISYAGFAVAVVLVAHIVFVIFGAPGDTQLVSTVARVADVVALFFPGLIAVGDPTLQVITDFGLAAVFWVLVANVLARVLG